MSETQVVPPPAPTQQQFPEEFEQIPTGLQAEAQPPEDGSVTWTASEFIAHDKSASWYAAFVAVATVLIGSIYFVSREIFPVIALSFGALLFGIYASRQPRQLQYTLDGSGIGIGKRHYSYDQFRSFSVVPEGAFSSVIFMPLKRFSPSLTIYYAPEDEERVLSVLSTQLPFDQHKLDLTDRFMRHIRF